MKSIMIISGGNFPADGGSTQAKLRLDSKKIGLSWQVNPVFLTILRGDP